MSNDTTPSAAESRLNAWLMHSESAAIGSDACDGWTASMALCGLIDPRIIAGYCFEAEAAFAGWFA